MTKKELIQAMKGISNDSEVYIEKHPGGSLYKVVNAHQYKMDKPHFIVIKWESPS